MVERDFISIIEILNMQVFEEFSLFGKYDDPECVDVDAYIAQRSYEDAKYYQVRVFCSLLPLASKVVELRSTGTRPTLTALLKSVSHRAGIT